MSASGAAYVLMAANLPGRAGQAAMLRELRNLGQALHGMHRAEGAAHRARDIEQAVRTELSQVAGSLRHPERIRPEQAPGRTRSAEPQRGPTVQAQPRIGPRPGVTGPGRDQGRDSPGR